MPSPPQIRPSWVVPSSNVSLILIGHAPPSTAPSGGGSGRIVTDVTSPRSRSTSEATWSAIARQRAAENSAAQSRGTSATAGMRLHPAAAIATSRSIAARITGVCPTSMSPLVTSHGE